MIRRRKSAHKKNENVASLNKNNRNIYTEKERERMSERAGEIAT